MLSPFYLLAIVGALSVCSAVVHRIIRHRRSEQVRQLAALWKMNYSERDYLRLTEKVARCFPVPGAAHLLLTDLIYSSAADRYRYVFTAEFTTGVLQHKRRVARVAYYSEPRERGGGAQPPSIALAPQELEVPEQYRALLAPPK